MQTVTEQEAQALATLRDEPPFGVFLRWLERSREAYRDQCENQASERAAASAATLRDVLQEVGEARETMARFSNRRELEDASRQPGDVSLRND